MFFLVDQDLEQKIAGDEVAHAFAVGDAFAQVANGLFLKLQVAFEDFLHVLSHQDLVVALHVGQAAQIQDALDQPVGMAHFLDRFLVFLLAQQGHAPVAQRAGVQVILVDGRQLVCQLRVQMFDNLWILDRHTGVPLLLCLRVTARHPCAQL
ncbi:hypothetical protein GLUCOINTEAF2_0202579 [Komagataeibacter intermedius AF2]|uniref:Uncharacterized protein n=1 Tax=Komagataeibacter intermedius AF2 TaxID=1458464 RepID=A0A0N0MFC9_9PROT|nr:hypothetical protein GLUCOINTEAF2_0202579 [Komagataeibacter intermedius AF2]